MSSFTKEVSLGYYSKVFEIHKQVIEDAKTQALRLKGQGNASVIAHNILKESFNDFRSKLNETYDENSPCAVLIEGTLKSRKGEFLNKYSDLHKELRGILS